MERVTENDLAEMRSRGYDATTIDRARHALERTRAADRLIARIAVAFHGVILGGGVGLQEAQGLDDYEDEETCAAYRSADEKYEWRKISADDLNRCNSSLSFFDAEGMRFHLPAYMTAELLGEYHFGMSFCLTYLNKNSRLKFAALDSVQRRAVREFLLFLREDPEYKFNRRDIDRALADYWIDIDAGKTSKAE